MCIMDRLQAQSLHHFKYNFDPSGLSPLGVDETAKKASIDFANDELVREENLHYVRLANKLSQQIKAVEEYMKKITFDDIITVRNTHERVLLRGKFTREALDRMTPYVELVRLRKIGEETLHELVMISPIKSSRCLVEMCNLEISTDGEEFIHNRPEEFAAALGVDKEEE